MNYTFEILTYFFFSYSAPLGEQKKCLESFSKTDKQDKLWKTNSNLY